MPTIQCTAKILGIGSWAVVRIPKEASEGLGSRSMVMIDGKINDLPFATPLEPDGKGSHWFRLSEAILKAGKLAIGDTIKLEFSQTENWVEPELPPDLEEALKAASLLEEP